MADEEAQIEHPRWRGLSKYCEGRSRAFNDMTVLETRRMEDLFSPEKPYKKQNKKRLSVPETKKIIWMEKLYRNEEKEECDGVESLETLALKLAKSLELRSFSL
uniref:Uncharacterized protein n=1 Tax=Fagus sylvatica TaxID=28930 RepID=A0A2N9IB48_FAGSY